MAKREEFLSVITSGGLLPAEFLKKIALPDKSIGYTSKESYDLLSSDRIEEMISRSSQRLRSAWKFFTEQLESDNHRHATSITRDRWMRVVFEELGWGKLEFSPTKIIDDNEYPISHFFNEIPIHITGYNIDIDKRTKGVAGAAKKAPHSMVQEYLNEVDESRWGIVTNGLKLRILRDNVSIVKQAYIEFDLENLFNSKNWKDFRLFWLLCHRTRFERGNDIKCILEKWMDNAQSLGMRLHEKLTKGVCLAISRLGSGFLKHPHNYELRKKIQDKSISKLEFYKQLQRLIYRLIFLFVAEDRFYADRRRIFSKSASPETMDRYLSYYSTRRIRELADTMKGTRHSDLFENLKVVMKMLSNGENAEKLGLYAMNSRLWASEAIQDLQHCELANRDFLTGIRAIAYTNTEGALYPVDYKNIGAEEIGGIYESLLEYIPIIAEGRRFVLKVKPGNERKTTGSFYTPDSLVNQLLDTALDPVLNRAAKSKNPEDAILALRICDPACGSGHFLVGAAKRIAKKLASIRTGEIEPTPDPIRESMRDVVRNCIFGVDVNPDAVELCQFSLWMETILPDAPLSFIEHHIKCGNSLIHSNRRLINKGIPNEAFDAITGDDKKVAGTLKKKNKRERDNFEIGNLFDETFFIKQVDWSEMLFDGDMTMNGRHQKAIEYKSILEDEVFKQEKLEYDAWCAAFLSKNEEVSITTGKLNKICRKKEPLIPYYQDTIDKIVEEHKIFQWRVEFFDVFKSSLPKNKQGFDVVLGNPPWERVKLQEKEWFTARKPEIAKARSSIRKKMIKALEKDDPDTYNEFIHDKRKAEAISLFLRNSGLYPLSGMGDINQYQCFAELATQLIKPDGMAGIICPTGIATDNTMRFFFQHIVEENRLRSLYDFENKNLFPSVHSSFKFSLMTLSGNASSYSKADFVFFARDADELKDDNRHFQLTTDDIKLINPNTMNCPIFRSKHDAEITKRIYRKLPVLIEENTGENPWNIRFNTMFHMSGDSGLFKTREDLLNEGWELDGNIFKKESDMFLPLYEAKLIHHYDHRWATYENGKPRDITLEEKKDTGFFPMPRYWVKDDEVENRLDGKWDKDWLIGFRDITNVTNERTVICSLLPRTGVGNSCPLIFLEKTDFSVCFVANITSFVLDYIARQKIGGVHLNYLYFKQLPILPPETYEKPCTWDDKHSTIADWIKERVIELVYTSEDMRTFALDMGYEGDPFKWYEDRRFHLRCELDALFFKLYGIEDEAEIRYIMDSFPIVKRRDNERFGKYGACEKIIEYMSNISIDY